MGALLLGNLKLAQQGHQGTQPGARIINSGGGLRIGGESAVAFKHQGRAIQHDLGIMMRQSARGDLSGQDNGRQRAGEQCLTNRDMILPGVGALFVHGHWHANP